MEDIYSGNCSLKFEIQWLVAQHISYTFILVRENQDKGVTKRGTTLVSVYKIDKNVTF